MATTHRSKVVIIGSGPAGYSAAIYAARANLEPIMVQGLEPGGQLTITTDVENYPGFADIIQGPWLMEQMAGQAGAVGTRLVHDMIVAVDLAKRPFVCTGDSGDVYIGDTVIICTGAQAKWLGLESEQRFMGFGVSACATCDGFFFRGKEVAVIGGGNTAVEEALYLTNHASKVTLVHRRDALRAEKILQDRLFRNEKIEVLWDHVLDEIEGESDPLTVTGIAVRHVKSDAVQRLPLSGVFIAIGHRPNTDLFEGQLKRKENGYLVTQPDSSHTDVEGVFACGDVQDDIYRQAVTAAGSGCMAAIDAERWLESAGHG